MTCPDCGETNNQSSAIHIERYNIQSATLIPVTDSNQFNTDSCITIHLEDDLVGDFSDGDLVTAVVDYRQTISKGLRGIQTEGQRLATHSLNPPTETDLQKTDWYPSGRRARIHTPKTLKQLIIDLEVCLSGSNLTEAEVQHKIITPILERIGWDKYDNTRFSLERSSENSQRRADYILSNSNGSPVLLVETKSSEKSLSRSTQQLTEYLNEYESPYGLLTNGREYQLFKRTPQNGEVTITEQDATKFPNPDPDFFKRLAFEE
jgi:Uma2 family endonuclease